MTRKVFIIGTKVGVEVIPPVDAQHTCSKCMFALDRCHGANCDDDGYFIPIELTELTDEERSALVTQRLTE